MPRKCANWSKIRAARALLGPHLSLRVPCTGCPATQRGRTAFTARQFAGPAVSPPAPQGRATEVGVDELGELVEPLVDPTFNSGVRFLSNGRMIVLLFGEFTSCFSAWM